MSYTLAQLVAQARIDLDDEEIPGGGDDTHSRWSNILLTEYINRAEREACNRAELIVDSETPAICEIAVVAGTNEYIYDDRIVWIKRAKLANRRCPLESTTSAQLDEDEPNWENREGEPGKYVLDLKENKIQFNRVPTDDDTLTLTVHRLPENDLDWASNSETPEIHQQYHIHLLDWVYHLAYSQHDEDTYNEKLSNTHAAKFEAMFGRRRSINRLVQMRRQSRARKVRPCWF